MKYLFYLLILVIPVQNIAQYPAIKRSLTFGGSSLDQGQTATELPNGDFLIAGQTQSSDGDVSGFKGIMDLWLIKLSASGKIYESRCYGGSEDEWAVKLLQTHSGLMVLATVYSNNGDVSGNHGEYDVWLLELDHAGTILNQRCIGGSANDYANDIITTSDGGYLIAATTYSNDGDVRNNHGDADIWIVKLLSNGTIAWQKTLGGTGSEQGASVLETEEGNYIVSSSGSSTDGSLSNHHGGNDVWIVELSNTGNILRQRCYGGTADEFAGAIALQAGNILGVTATTASNDGDVSGQHGGTDLWFFHLNIQGKLTYQRCLGGTGNEQAKAIKPKVDGGWFLAAATFSFDGDVFGNHGRYDTWLLEINMNGNLVTKQCYGGNKDDLPNALLFTSEGHWAVCGYSHSQTGDLPKNEGESDVWVFQLYKQYGAKPATVISKQIQAVEY